MGPGCAPLGTDFTMKNMKGMKGEQNGRRITAAGAGVARGWRSGGDGDIESEGGVGGDCVEARLRPCPRQGSSPCSARGRTATAPRWSMTAKCWVTLP